MIIKSYIENTAAAALKKIREEMGQQALILHTRHIRGGQYGRRIEVTACIDESLVRSLKSLIDVNAFDKPGKPGVMEMDVDDSLKVTVDRPVAEASAMVAKPEELRKVYDKLIDFDIPAGPADKLITDIQKGRETAPLADSSVRTKLKSSFESLIKREVHIPVGSKVMFIGASGAGKTSTLAKMAAELTAFRRTKVRLTSFDTRKISVYEEVGGYADLLDAPYEINPRKELKAGRDEVLLIDTPSMSYSTDGITTVQNLINLVRPDIVFMVLSVCNRADDIIDFKEGIQIVQPNMLIATHLDETRRWGSMLAAAIMTGIPLAFVTDSPGGVGQLHVPDPEQMLAKMMNEKEAHRE
jgi:flagellar biosynthesis protein FlhF